MYRSRECNGEKVIGQLTARLVPPNDQYPDCMCELLITEQSLYVLEDDFDGSYTCHFVFPLNQVVSIEKTNIAGVPGNNNTNVDTTAQQNMIAFAMASFGSVYALKTGGSQKGKAAAYVAVSYQNAEGAGTIFFDDFQSDTKKFITAYQTTANRFG